MRKPILVVFAVLLMVTPVASTLPANDATRSTSTDDRLPADDSLAAGYVSLPNDVTTDEVLTSNNTAPLVDAGLDQDVTKGATVLLDATGSSDPGGRIERYRWTIHTPSGAAVTPDCADCARTEFTPSQTGRYRVTLTATDDDGTTRTDTLYVDVSPGTKPSVSLSGPRQPTEGTSATYTANLTVGDAALEYVVWTVDGTEIANHSLSAEQEIDTVAKRFPTAGERTISATVYDADGQSATSSLDVMVQRERRIDSPNNASRTGGSPGSSTSIADRHDPIVFGDAVVTGAEPLRGRYEIRLDAGAGSVTSVEWWNVAGPIGSGRTLTETWEPGDHQLYAVVTYTDGSENVATFADGTTTVTADPEPRVSVESLDRYGSIRGTSLATDEYENLDTLRVEIDGKTVASARSSVRGRIRLDHDRQRSLRFSHYDFTPGRQYTVTVIATDERGQKVRASREIVPVREPEIVRSEFVNGPVDSYHERIDPNRYAAHHVLEVDLNGVDIENVSVTVKGNTVGTEDVDRGRYSPTRTYKRNQDSVVMHTFWKGDSPGNYEIRYKYNIIDVDKGWKLERKDRFKVTPSRPELRLDVLNDGTKDYITREHGILVDASKSFDPDGTDLNIIWKHGAEPTKPDNTTAKFWAYERAAVVIEDEYDLKTRRNINFLSYFVPDIEATAVSTDGPYLPNGTVRVRIKTEPYHFSKQTYYELFSLGLTVSNPKAKVIEWKEVKAPDSAHQDPTEDAYRYVATIEIPASELTPGSARPSITVFNEDNERKTDTVDFPDVNVLLKDRTYWDDVTITNLSYIVEKPDIHEVTAESKKKRDAYLDRGYSLDETKRETKYSLEKRVKVQNAKYEQITRNFGYRVIRDMFVRNQPDWYRSGTRLEEVTRTKTDTEWYDATAVESTSRWHDSDPSNGEYAGRSRTVLVHPAVYQRQVQYRYEYEVQKTATRTVTRRKTVTFYRTDTRTVTRCSRKFGCHSWTETYQYPVTQTYTYTTTQRYTYTVTRTGTYWVSAHLQGGGKRTGRTRRVKIEDAVYETQYAVEYQTQYTDTVTRYVAARDEMVQPAKYEWRKAQSTTNPMLARRQTAINDDWRIGETTTNTTWTLSKRRGTVRFVTSQYKNPSYVVETAATLEGTLIQQYHNVEIGKKVRRTIGDRSKRVTFEGTKDRQAIIDEVTDSGTERGECKRKGLC